MKKIILILFLVSVQIYAQEELLFEHFSIEHGLSQSNVRCIMQDRQGFLWLGTEDGLNRYDGYNFQVFKNIIEDSTSLSANYINSLAEDKYGYIWIATDGGGICRYNPATNTFNKYMSTGNLDMSAIYSIFIDSDNNIWAGTYLRGLVKYVESEDRFISFINDSAGPQYSCPSGIILSIYEDREKNLWLGSFDAGIINFDREKGLFKACMQKDGLSSDFVQSISEDNKGNLIIGTMGGLSILNNEGRFLNYYHYQNDSKSLSSNKIKSVFVSKNNIIYAGTENAGLNIFDPGSNSFYQYKAEGEGAESISSNNIFCFYEDYSGIVWIGTDGGLNKIKKTKKFERSLQKMPGQPSGGKRIRSILEDNEKNIWVGTDNSLMKLDPVNGKIKSITAKNLQDTPVWALADDNKGHIWIGSGNGLNRLDKTTGRLTYFYNNQGNDSYLYNNIKSLLVDEDILWIGTYGKGLVKFIPEQEIFIPFNPSKGETQRFDVQSIHQIYKSSKGEYWFCTTTGLFQYLPSSDELKYILKVETEENTYPYEETMCLYEDSDCMWLGTYGGGLAKFIPGRGIVKRYLEQHGLSNNNVYAILSDNRGNLWLSTNKGISKFNIKEESFKNYFTSDGLPSNEFNGRAYLKSSSGKLYFGSIEGIVSFFPNDIEVNSYIPPIAITGFKVFDKPFFNKLNFKNNDTITLSYAQNFFSFEFTALDFTEPLKNQYAYMLEGYDKDWIYSEKRRYAAYTNLDPGSYLFRVKGSNNDGIWNEEGVAVAVIITPPFWATWWFRTALIMFFLSIGPIIYYKRVNALKKENIRKEEFSRSLITSQENERMRIASELHDSIGQNLIIIKNRAAFGMNNSGAATNEQLKEIVDISSQTIREVREISYNLRPYQLGKLGLTKAVEAVIRSAASAANLNFNVDIENIDGLLSNSNDIHFYRIVQECLNNTLKHSKASEVVINISRRNGLIHFIYKDNGVGFNIESVRNKEVSGMGLTGISERVSILSGRFTCDSQPGKGVRLLIEIPEEETDIEKRN